jgi:hypothetical protein
MQEQTPLNEFQGKELTLEEWAHMVQQGVNGHIKNLCDRFQAQVERKCERSERSVQPRMFAVGDLKLTPQVSDVTDKPGCECWSWKGLTVNTLVATYRV